MSPPRFFVSTGYQRSSPLNARLGDGQRSRPVPTWISGGGRRDRGLGERSVGRGETRHRHAERRAADVGQTVLVAPADRHRVAAMLAADADLEMVADRSTALTAVSISDPTASVSIEVKGSCW